MATLDEIKRLRSMTGAGISAVKEALDSSGGDEKKALQYLRQKGMAKADKRKDNVAANGILGVYVHTNNRVVTVVEVDCETDFAAKSPDMQKFANDIALQIAAANPEFINIESVSDEKKSEIMDTAEKDLEGKPDNVKESIIKGKLDKYFKDAVLMEQVLFVDDTKTVKDYLNELVAKIGEKIVIRNFYKFQVAQDVKYCSLNNEEESNADKD
ncbi:MAG: translation elongation factor Ts [Candidatus Dojkabacteria bacterium]